LKHSVIEKLNMPIYTLKLLLDSKKKKNPQFHTSNEKAATPCKTQAFSVKKQNQNMYILYLLLYSVQIIISVILNEKVCYR